MVETTTDSRLQTAANLAVANGLEEYDQRHGFRGVEAHIDLDREATTADWEETLLPHRPVSGLEPGLVVEAEEEGVFEITATHSVYELVGAYEIEVIEEAVPGCEAVAILVAFIGAALFIYRRRK